MLKSLPLSHSLANSSELFPSYSFIHVIHCPKSNIESWSWGLVRKGVWVTKPADRVWLQQRVSLLLLNCFDASAAHCFLQGPLSSKAWTAVESCISCYTELSTKAEIKTRANPVWTLAKITLSSYIKGKHLAWPHKRENLKDCSALWNLTLDGMETKRWLGNFSSSFHILLSPLYFWAWIGHCIIPGKWRLLGHWLPL